MFLPAPQGGFCLEKSEFSCSSLGTYFPFLGGFMKSLSVFALLALILAPLPALAVATPGEPAPDFNVTDIAGKPVKLSELKGKYVVLEWTNHGCPYVRKHYDSGNMQSLQEQYTDEGAVWIVVNSSAAGKEGNETKEEAADRAKKEGWEATHVVLDPEGKLGMAYGAKTTPHMFLIDKKGKVAYAGAIDSKATSEPSDLPTAINYIHRAFKDLKAGKPVTTASTRAYGCGVKYP
jgi:peroxiredoxin